MLTGFSYSQKIKDSELSRSEQNDCVVKSLSIAYDISYDEAHKIAKEKFEREYRRGVYNTASKFSFLQNSNFIYNKKSIYRIAYSDLMYEGSIGYQKKYSKYGLDIYKTKKTVKIITEEYNKGRFIILVSGHAFAMIDGIIYGNWEDKRKSRVKVLDLIELKDVES